MAIPTEQDCLDCRELHGACPSVCEVYEEPRYIDDDDVDQPMHEDWGKC